MGDRKDGATRMSSDRKARKLTQKSCAILAAIYVALLLAILQLFLLWSRNAHHDSSKGVVINLEAGGGQEVNHADAGVSSESISESVSTVNFYVFRLHTLDDQESLLDSCLTNSKAGTVFFFFRGLLGHKGRVWNTSLAAFLVVPIPFGCLAAHGKGHIAKASLKELQSHEDFSWAVNAKLLVFTIYFKGWRLLFSEGSISDHAISKTITSIDRKSVV